MLFTGHVLCKHSFTVLSPGAATNAEVAHGAKAVQATVSWSSGHMWSMGRSVPEQVPLPACQEIYQDDNTPLGATRSRHVEANETLPAETR